MKKLIIGLIVVIVVLVVVLAFNFKDVYLPKAEQKVEQPKIVLQIKEYDYHITERSSAYEKQVFEELSQLLNQPINNQEYAKSIVKNYITQFFTLQTKTSPLDVGGEQFVLEEYRNSFVQFAKDGIYKQVSSQLNDNKKLPIVKEVTISTLNEITYKYKDQKYNAFEIQASWSYEIPNDFQNKATLVLIPNGKKYEIVEMK